MSSQASKFTFPRTLSGQHKITSAKSSDFKQTQDTERCIYIVQEYDCAHHPSLNTPQILHRAPCTQALLPVTSQIDCGNYIQDSRYEKKRGCMECKYVAQKNRDSDAIKHPEIFRKMQEMGLEQESIDHFEKVTSSFPASRRVLELVRERVRREEREEEARKQIVPKQETNTLSSKNDTEVISPAALFSVVEGLIVEQNDAVEKERKAAKPQPTSTEVESPQLETILEISAPAFAPEAEVPSNIVATPLPSSPLEEETLNQPEAAEIQLLDTPAQSTAGEEKAPPSPEKLTDNIHFDLDEDWNWDDQEPERVFGEVALAPSFSYRTGDEWIVVGSWEQ